MANTETEPIKDTKKVALFLDVLNAKHEKCYVIAKVQVNTGLRISDVIPLRYSDLFDKSSRWKQHLYIKEKKTGKAKSIKLNTEAKSALDWYIKKSAIVGNDMLFAGKSAAGHLSYVQVYRVFKQAAEALGLERFGTHSLRKTWGYFSYKQSKYNLALIMATFGHSNPSDTLRYIGISQDDKDELYSAVKF